MKRLFCLSIAIILLVNQVMPLPTNVLQVHYQLLNVNPLATQEELDEGKEKMLASVATEFADKADTSILKRKIEEAYAVLSNPVQRKRYDASLQPDVFTTTTFEHFERTGVLYHHEQCILYESLNLSSNASDEEVHEACTRLLDQGNDDESQERILKRIAATEALLTHPIIKKCYKLYSAHQLHSFSEKLANQHTSLVPWKSYYDILNLSQETNGSELQKAVKKEIAQLDAQLKKIKTSTSPSLLVLRNKQQLLESIKTLLSDQQERYKYDLFLKTLFKSLSEENAYYKLLKIYNDADKAALDAAYKRFYNDGISALQDLKDDELLEQRYVNALRSTAYIMLSNPKTRKDYDTWQKIRAQEKTKLQGTPLNRSLTTSTPFISNSRIVLKKGGGYRQQVSPLQARLTRTFKRRPGQNSQLYKPTSAKTGAEIVPTSRAPVRRHILKKRPGSLPSKKSNKTTPPQTKALQKLPPVRTKETSPLTPRVTKKTT